MKSGMAQTDRESRRWYVWAVSRSGCSPAFFHQYNAFIHVTEARFFASCLAVDGVGRGLQGHRILISLPQPERDFDGHF